MQARHLTALGTIQPAQKVQLSFLTSGLLRVIEIQLGEQVRAGELLAELDTTDLDLAVREAEEGVALQQASLAQARAGARPQELAIARAEYERALAQHEGVLAAARPEEIAVAQADYDAALARYEQVSAGAESQELAAAQTRMEKAEAALRRAQAAYDVVAWRPDVASSSQALELQEATLDYQAARAEHERLQNLPAEADLKEAKAQLVSAKAQIELAQAGPTAQEVAASSSGLAIVQAQFALKEAGPRAEDVAVAKARVQQARTALELAKLDLSRAQLRAPFDGAVSAVFLSPGEWAAAGAPVAELLDTTHWRVETRNVGELEIGRMRVGQEAQVRVLAFGEELLRGQVVAISPVAVVQQGDTTYTLLIELEPTDLNLRPGMNAEVEIITD